MKLEKRGKANEQNKNKKQPTTTTFCKGKNIFKKA